MVDEAIQKRDRIAATYLQQLQALAAEVAASMDAIAGNAISRFQESVARQEMLCACLAQMANTVSEGFRSPEKPSPACIDPAMEQKIRAASGTLRELNLQYAALLKHSGRSIALLASLCRSHTGHFQEARGPRPKYQTWSCEM
ncbi:MAG: hypothetical protein ABSE99_01415 [Terracidiphilus sp.]|jgi:hypothetical protein